MEKKLIAKRRQAVTIAKNYFEKCAWQNGTHVLGIDEVGRGCLAGPVVSAAVILPLHADHHLLKDSKIMTPEERLKAYKWITKHCIYSVGVIHHRIVDEVNIRQSTLISMKKAALNTLVQTPFKPSAIVVDAMPLSLHNTIFADIPIHFFNFGESLSISIAAASIVAKVTRDAMMDMFDSLFPGYGFTKNKGYGTATHQAGLIAQGYCLIHRITFLRSRKKKPLVDNKPKGMMNEQQGELFC